MDIFKFYQVENPSDIEIAAEVNDELLTGTAGTDTGKEGDEVLRIEEKVYASWKGVRGCCDQSTVDGQAKNAWLEWVKQQMFIHQDLQCIKYGHGGGRASCGNSGGDWGTPRRCVGSLTITCYIEFEKRKK